MDRTLPHNLEAEKCVLGAVLINNHAFNQASEVLTSDDFFRDAHRRIYEKMIALSERSEPIDLVTLKDELIRSGDLDEVGGPAYIITRSPGGGARGAGPGGAGRPLPPRASPFPRWG